MNDILSEYKLAEKLIKTLKEKQIINKNSHVLEAGCGTGNFTIALAKEVQKVLALDSSTEMLEMLKEYAWNQNLTSSIKTQCNNLNRLNTNERFNLVFVSSSVLKNYQDFQTLFEYSKGNICVVSFIYHQDSNLKNLVSSQFKTYQHSDEYFNQTKKWLNKLNIPYYNDMVTHSYDSLLSKNSAVLKLKEIIGTLFFDLALSEEEAFKLIQPHMKNNVINYEVNFTLEFLYWNK